MTKRIELANVSEIPEKMGQVFKVDDKEIAVFRLSNGDVRAVENRSPHPKGGTLVRWTCEWRIYFLSCL